MYSKVKILGHPIHAILVAYPIAFYSATTFSFIIYYFNQSQFAFQFGFTCNLLGIATAVLAALPGFIDWAVGIPNEHPAKSKGMEHMLLNVFALLLFAVSFFLVKDSWEGSQINIQLPLILTIVGLVCTFIAGFIGGEIMQKDHVGIILTPEQERLEAHPKR